MTTEAFAGGDEVIVDMFGGPRRGLIIEDKGRARVRLELHGIKGEKSIPRERVRLAKKGPWKGSRMALHEVRAPTVPNFVEAFAQRAQRAQAAVDEILRPVPKPPKPDRDRGYLVYVREHPCCACTAPAPSDPHHYGPRGMGQKTDDYRTVPLCRGCHDCFHQHGFVARFEAEADAVQLTRVLFLQTQVDLMIGYKHWRALNG